MIRVANAADTPQLAEIYAPTFWSGVALRRELKEATVYIWSAVTFMVGADPGSFD